MERRQREGECNSSKDSAINTAMTNQVRELEGGLQWKLPHHENRGAVLYVAHGGGHGRRERCKNLSQHRLHNHVGDLIADGYLRREKQRADG